MYVAWRSTGQDPTGRAEKGHTYSLKDAVWQRRSRHFRTPVRTFIVDPRERVGWWQFGIVRYPFYFLLSLVLYVAWRSTGQDPTGRAEKGTRYRAEISAPAPTPNAAIRTGNEDREFRKPVRIFIVDPDATCLQSDNEVEAFLFRTPEEHNDFKASIPRQTSEIRTHGPPSESKDRNRRTLGREGWVLSTTMPTTWLCGTSPQDSAGTLSNLIFITVHLITLSKIPEGCCT